MRQNYHQGLTIIEVLVIISVIALVIGIGLPAINAMRRTSSGTLYGTQVRGIHGGLVLFAQGNNGYYPGWNGRDFSFTPPTGWSQGEPDGRDVSQRYALMLLSSYFTGEYIISPAETKPIWTTGEVSTANFSYALLQLPSPNAPTETPSRPPVLRQVPDRLAEWSVTKNTLAPVIADRSIVNDPSLHTTSIWVTTTTTASSGWRGSVAWNDGHCSFRLGSTLATTKYGSVTNTNDDLFTATSDSDALMTYGGK